MSKFNWLSLICVCASLAGCASTDDSLQRATAISIGNGVDPDQIVVTDVDRGATTVKWIAKTSSGIYKCSADDMVRRPYCVKK